MINLLIVDDETSIAELLAEVFSLEGFNCDCSYSGNQAIQKLADKKFDLIISDVKMGDGDGPSLLNHVKTKDLGIPLIFITGHSEFTENELRDQGALQVFYKPLDLDQFIQEVKVISKTLS